jgi:hypothetical protein
MICDNFPTCKETKKVGYTPRAYVRETWTHDFYVLLSNPKQTQTPDW